MNGWYVLGFSADAVVGAWQHERLARACMSAWIARGRPSAWRIAEAPAPDGDYVLHWYVNGAAASALDEADVNWRGFVVGQLSDAPSDVRSLLDPALGP